jgi:hypothetical protein
VVLSDTDDNAPKECDAPLIACGCAGTSLEPVCDQGTWQCPACDDCFSSDECGADRFCDHGDGSCGATKGTCRPRPSACDLSLLPVCGCDGDVYSNACLATQAGVDLAADGACTPPVGSFACGPIYCNTSSELCEIRPAQNGEAATYACKLLSDECAAAPSCACLDTTTACDGVCADAGGGLVVTCG